MLYRQSIGFRAVTKDDVDELHRMLNDRGGNKYFHPHPFTRETIQKICTGNTDYYYVMTLNDKIIGYSMLRLFGTNIPSFGCYIHRQHRGNGYGRLLTQWTLMEAERLGYTKIILRVHQKNVTAIQTYLTCGFHPIDSEVRMEYP